MTFEFDGDKYLKASKHQKEWGQKLINEFQFIGNESILELGCGDGMLTKIIADRIPDGSILGIDISKGMINKAKELTQDNLLFQLMNINDINFRDKFDTIISNATLHWVLDHKKLIKNCHTALKESGVVRFNFAGDGNCSNLITVIRDIMKNEEYKEYFANFKWPWYMPTTDDYRQLLTINNFREIRIWDENADRYFRDVDKMIGWIDQPAIVPFITSICDSKKESFRKAVIDSMISITRGEDGRCFETFRRINVYAKK